jgi:hypothetical protein
MNIPSLQAVAQLLSGTPKAYISAEFSKTGFYNALNGREVTHETAAALLATARKTHPGIAGVKLINGSVVLCEEAAEIAEADRAQLQHDNATLAARVRQLEAQLAELQRRRFHELLAEGRSRLAGLHLHHSRD